MKIVLLGRMAAAGERLLRAQLPVDFEIAVLRDPADPGAAEICAEAEVIVGGPVTPEVVQRARGLKLFQSPGAGMNGLGVHLLPDGVILANTYHHETAIAEYVLMVMMALQRRLIEYDRKLREGTWDGSCVWGEPPAIPQLSGKTILILGFGKIGQAVSHRARPFGMRILAVSRRPKHPQEGADAVVSYKDWEDHIAESDFLLVACPLTSATRALVGEPQINRMKTSAYLINVARGPIVDEQALYEALRGGRIAGAALDVWCRYPRRLDEKLSPSKFPFEELPNVLLTPHVSGWTAETVEGRMRDIAENIRRLHGGQPLLNLVDRSDI